MIGDLSSLISPFDLPSTATEIRRGDGGGGGGGGERKYTGTHGQHVEIVKIIQTEAVHFHNGERQTETDTDRERQRQKNRDRRTEERQTDRQT